MENAGNMDEFSCRITKKKQNNEYLVYISNEFKINELSKDIVFNLNEMFFREATIDDTKTRRLCKQKKYYIDKNGNEKQSFTGYQFTFSSIDTIITGDYIVKKDGDIFYLIKKEE